MKPLHQDFLDKYIADPEPETLPVANEVAGDLDSIPDLGEENELFDHFFGWKRKVRLTDLDSRIGAKPHWEAFLSHVPDSGLLYIVDNRSHTSNPILAKYGKFTKWRYSRALSARNVRFKFAAYA